MPFSMQTAADRLTALFMQGNALAAKAQYREALKIYDKILTKVPAHLDVINNRANCLSALGRYEQAIKSYSTILAARPNDVRARTNRASGLKQLGRFDEALLDYDFVLKIDPDYSDALYNRGNTLADLQRPREAVESYRRAIAIKPDEPNVHTALIFALNFIPEMTNEALQAERAAWGARYGSLLDGRKHSNEPRSDRTLRVGYVSAHLRHQAATYAFGSVIIHHDPGQFEITCYSDTAPEDDVTRLLRGHVQKWRCTSHLSDDELSSQIRADGIDILVDLVGHMKGHRLPVFARKPAPIQITAWGEPTGTGLKAIDYIFADPVIIPPAERTLLTEKVADLPNFIGFWSPEQLPDPNPLPALSRGYVTFGSFNRLPKVLPEVLQCWAAILAALPNSRLVLKDRLLDGARQKQAILGAFANKGIVADRVTILDQGSRANHFAAYHDIDIALDPFPHSGGMTTLDALWMGVPVITCPGRTISSRLAAASLTAAGLKGYIASDFSNYVDLSVAKARDIQALAELREKLRSHIETTAFGDPRRYAQAVEAQYRAMWQRWCENPNRAPA